MSWWNCNWNGLEPETANLIEQVGYSDRDGEKHRVREYKCGCERSFEKPPLNGEWFHICCWHEGYDEAVVDIRGQEE